ncbi:hypothetical protein Tco_1423942 [Tanacetum coccineum]
MKGLEMRVKERMTKTPVKVQWRHSSPFWRSNQSSQRHESKGMKRGIVFEERPREAIDVPMMLKRRVMHLIRKDLLVILSR